MHFFSFKRSNINLPRGTQQPSPSNEKLSCDPCREGKRDVTAVFNCQACDEMFCEGCSKVHSSQKLTKSHTLVDVSSVAFVSLKRWAQY